MTSALLILTPIGLGLDLLGVGLLLVFGNARHIWVSSSPPHPDLGKDGDLYLQTDDPSGTPTAAGLLKQERRQQFAWRVAVGLIMVGFGLQLVGAITALGN